MYYMGEILLGNFPVLGICFVISLVSILSVLIIASRLNLYDTIDERKIHEGNIPRLGGVGFVLAFIAGVTIFYFTEENTVRISKNIWYMVTGGLLIFAMGVWDDIRPWRARRKLLVQVLAAGLTLAGGFTFHKISFSSFGINWNLGLFRYPVTFLWIIGVTNAVNLIDGLDGLAGSIAVLVSLTYALFFYRYGNQQAMMLCLLVAVSVSGFLVYNLPFPRAKIFMGDGGSQYLGYILACLPLITNSAGLATISMPYAAAVLIIPIFDTFAALWRRKRDGMGFFDPDQFHLHHKLILIGFSKRQTLVLIMMFQLLLSIFIALAGWTGGLISSMLVLAVYLMGILFFTVIHIRKEGALEENGHETTLHR